MKKKIWIAVGIISLIIIMTGFTIYRQAFAKGPDIKTELVKSEEISSTLMIPGTLKLQDQQKIYVSPENGKIKEVLVVEGQEVKKGDVLATLENEQFQLEMDQNKLSIESSNLRINQIKKQLTALEVKQSDLAQEIGDKEAKKQLKPEFDGLDMEKKLADLELKQTLLQKQALESRMEKLNIVSLIDGVVLSLNSNTVQSSLMVTEANEPLMIIGNLGTMISEGTLSEYDTMKVAVGQKVNLSSDAVPGEVWEGEVFKLSTLPKDNLDTLQGNNQAVQYPIVVKVTSEQVNLKPGFQLIMEIKTETKNGLVIPSDSLLNNESKTYVYVLEENIARKKEVQVGIMAGENVEIVKGLKEKDEVIISSLDQINDGMEVNKK